jgi:hypothetical protein
MINLLEQGLDQEINIQPTCHDWRGGKDMNVLSNFRMALSLVHGKILDMTTRITLIT